VGGRYHATKWKSTDYYKTLELIMVLASTLPFLHRLLFSSTIRCYGKCFDNIKKNFARKGYRSAIRSRDRGLWTAGETDTWGGTAPRQGHMLCVALL
jgi:hypothetical protein